jgi:hypothetical protein
VLLKDSEDLLQVNDGVLCFLDMPTFDYYLNSLLAMPDSLRKLQEAQWGFTSMELSINNIYNLGDIL